jgi:hypothetical protein
LQCITINNVNISKLDSAKYDTVDVNMVVHPLQLTAKIIVTMPRNITNIHNVIEFDQHVNLIPKTLVFEIEND